MTAEALITAFFARGIRFIANPPKLTVEPASRLTEADRELIRAHKPALLDFLLKGQEERTKTGEATLSNRGPAFSIVETCQRYGVALRVDPETGDLVVGKAGATADDASQPWRSLLLAIEAHPEEVAILVEAGWTFRAGFPVDRAA